MRSTGLTTGFPLRWFDMASANCSTGFSAYAKAAILRCWSTHPLNALPEHAARALADQGIVRGYCSEVPHLPCLIRKPHVNPALTS